MARGAETPVARGAAMAAAEAGPAAGDGTPRDGRPRRAVPAGLVLLLVCLGQFMVILDVSIVNVALPSIRADLGFSAASLQWVVNSYTLAFAGFLMLGGRAADLFGRRRVFLLGVALFALASLAGGLAANQAELIAARTLQGLGGAILAPATLTLLLTSYPEGAARARALGVWSAVAAAGGASGALLGGVLTDVLGWRWILFVNVPVGLAVLAGARLALAESRGPRQRGLDLWGALTVTAGLVAVVWGIARSEAIGWGAGEVVAAFAAGAALLAAFVLIEWRLSPAPLVPLRVFRSRSVSAANVSMFALAAAIFPVWYFISLYLQTVRGLSPLLAGLAFLPQTLMIVAGSQISARLLARIGPRPVLVAGPLISALGLVWLSQLPLDGNLLTSVVIPGGLVTFGMGVVFPAVAFAATSGVVREEAGLASGLVNTTRQVGASLGLALLITVATDRASSLATSGAGAAASLTHGYGLAFAVAALLTTAAALFGLAVPGRSRPQVAPAPGREADGGAEEPAAA